MKVVAIGFSSSSIKLLEVFDGSNFIDESYLGSSSNQEYKNVKGIKNLNINNFLKENWRNVNVFIFIGSVGATTRLISSFISSKGYDPGVIVTDKRGSKIIPVLNLHHNQTKNIALKLHNLIGGEIVETNNSSVENLLNLDSFGENWGWRRSGSTKDWSKLVINQSKNQAISFKQFSGNELWKRCKSSKNLNHLDDCDDIYNQELTFFVGIKKQCQTTWHPPTLWLGMGCERNTNKKFIQESLNQFLDDNEISLLSIAGIATVDLKKDEKAILDIARDNKWPIKFLTTKQLSKKNVPNPSQAVFDEIGSYSVAEASCLIAAGKDAKLLVEKHIVTNKKFSGDRAGAVTLAVAQSKNQFAPSRGHIHVIGSGPGNLSFLTIDAKVALSECPVWIGYKMYLDLLDPLLREDQIRIDSEITEEKKRCEKAISLAQEGIKVALVSSGDSSIYGMAGLLLELIQNLDKTVRPSFTIHPGISCIQLAASLAGSPLMNDFCAISLSDKLTPWEIIEKRIKGALLGDFVVAIFNPQSKERDWQLQKTIKMFLQKRKKETPILIARQVGRKDQKISFRTLEDFPYDRIDMLTLIIVGNSKTKLVGNKFISPRGYL